ncbi:MAG: DUF721 domain-containing protein [Proteobacteria bacterium]|nr:DUF721 domain-containing protein [Pseudomonadota bacterium]
MNTEKKNIPHSIRTLLQNQNSPIADICKKAHSIQEIDHKLKNLLDPSLKNHFELANIKTDIVILLVSSPAWATRLRYNIPAILNALNNQLNFTSVKTIRIKVRKAIPDYLSSNKKQIYLSDKSAQFLSKVANNFNDPQLRSCILRLSKNNLK